MRNIKDYAEQYVKSDFEMEYQVKYRRKKVLELMAKYSHKDFIEVGCGMDPLACYIDDFSKCTIVEPSDVFINNAMEHLKGKQDRMTFVKGELEQVISVLQGKHYDYIVVSSLLHEIENPSQLIKSILSLCDNNTVVHINVPNANSLHRILAKEAGLVKNEKEFSPRNYIFQQHNVFTDKELKTIVIETAAQEGKSVQILENGSFFVKPFTHRQMEQCLENGIITPGIVDGFDKIISYMPDLGSEIFLNFKLK